MSQNREDRFTVHGNDLTESPPDSNDQEDEETEDIEQTSEPDIKPIRMKYRRKQS